MIPSLGFEVAACPATSGSSLPCVQALLAPCMAEQSCLLVTEQVPTPAHIRNRMGREDGGVEMDSALEVVLDRSVSQLSSLPFVIAYEGTACVRKDSACAHAGQKKKISVGSGAALE